MYKENSLWKIHDKVVRFSSTYEEIYRGTRVSFAVINCQCNLCKGKTDHYSWISLESWEAIAKPIN